MNNWQDVATANRKAVNKPSFTNSHQTPADYSDNAKRHKHKCTSRASRTNGLKGLLLLFLLFTSGKIIENRESKERVERAEMHEAREQHNVNEAQQNNKLPIGAVQ